MSGRSISISSVYDWTDYVPRTRNHLLNGRFFKRRKNTITKGEQEIMTGIYNNRTEGKKTKSLTDLLMTGTCHKDAWRMERKIRVSPKETKTISLEETEIVSVSNTREKTARKINVYIPRAESPPHPPLPTPEIDRKSSSTASSSSELWPTSWENKRSYRSSIPLKSVRINYCDFPRTPSLS